MTIEAQLKYPAGELKQYSAAAAYTPGEVLVVGERIGVVSGSKPIAIGDDYTLLISGTFEIDAASADSWSDGDILYWDATGNELTDTASSHKSAGIAAADKAAAATVALVDLNASVGSTTI
jgi:predicted RecA/RadA family phage recombinase